MSNEQRVIFYEPQAYVGWGSVTLGAESSSTGFTVFHVTNTNDSGAGSLRDALSVGKRKIVFDVGGTINLVSDLPIRNSYTTVDGFSAPSPGIIVNQGVFDTSILGPINDVLVRGMSYIGNASFITDPYPHAQQGSSDVLGLDAGVGNVTRIIIDHCTLLDTNDGCIDRFTTGATQTLTSNLTVSNCVISGHDNVSNSIQKANVAGFSPRDRETWYRNVFAKNSDRQLRLCGACRQIDFSNNIVYGLEWWVNAALAKGIMNLGATAQFPGQAGWDLSINIENNWLMNPVLADRVALPPSHPQHLPAGSRCRPEVWIQSEDATIPPAQQQVWIAGNIFDVTETFASIASGHISMGAFEVQKIPATNLRDSLLPTVGAPFRTARDQGLIDEIMSYVP